MIKITNLHEKDINEIVSNFQAIGWNKPRSIYEKYLEEQLAHKREIFIAKINDKFAGYVTFKWHSDYENFRLHKIPEISDLNVLPTYRNQGIGSKLIAVCEARAKENTYGHIGLGVGLTADYGNAQKLYVKLGYIPDGHGLFYKNKKVSYLENTCVDDDLVIYLVKKLNRSQKINFDLIELKAATLKDYPTMQNMGRFYVYDMSEYLGNEDGWRIPKNGLYECIDFKKYFEHADSYPFLIYYQNELAGFVVVDKKACAKTTNFNVAQFFILRKFKNKGFGKYVAQLIFSKFPGQWEVMVMPNNLGAYEFWKKTIDDYTNVTEALKNVPYLENKSRIIFSRP